MLGPTLCHELGQVELLHTALLLHGIGIGTPCTMYGVTVTGCYRKGLVAVWSVEDVQHSVHLAGVICVVVIILSRGAKGRISLGLCHYLMWSHTARPSPDMVLTLQLPVSRTFKPLELDGSLHDTSSEVS